MVTVSLVPPAEAHSRAKDGAALLVCAYDSDDKFRNVHLDGAIAMSEFKATLDKIDKGKEIIFY